jgi:hypothetical protein
MQWAQATVTLIQTAVLVGGFAYTVRAIRHSNDARNVDFVISAEGQIDPLFGSLMTDSPEVVRAVLPALIPVNADAATTKTYAYVYFAYRHLSRIIYMLCNQSVSLGMSDRERDTYIDNWLNEVHKYDQEILRDIHHYCRTTGEFNNIFTEHMDRRYPPSPAA